MALVLLAGCAAREPASPPAQVQAWTFGGRVARQVVTPHYRIHTTIEDEELNQGLALLMEGALAEYRKLAPDLEMTTLPMHCYVFATRGDWEAYTRKTAGPDAAVYLQIAKGGYALRDTFAVFYLGDNGTYSVASHEGFHQFAARHFKGRLPPFLEEGLACLFENVSWDDGRPSWDLSINASRAAALRHAIDDGRLWPLEELISTHAGRVVGRPGEDVEAFYAQSWAFARFLLEAEEGRYRPAMQRLLADTASGSGGLPGDPAGWTPGSARKVLEAYLGTDLQEIEARYRTFLSEIGPRVDWSH